MFANVFLSKNIGGVTDGYYADNSERFFICFERNKQKNAWFLTRNIFFKNPSDFKCHENFQAWHIAYNKKPAIFIMKKKYVYAEWK